MKYLLAALVALSSIPAFAETGTSITCSYGKTVITFYRVQANEVVQVGSIGQGQAPVIVRSYSSERVLAAEVKVNENSTAEFALTKNKKGDFQGTVFIGTGSSYQVTCPVKNGVEITTADDRADDEGSDQ